MDRAPSGLVEVKRGAIFSPCGQFRYMLMREWGPTQARGYVGFLMLNPSTADGMKEDRTIDKCITITGQLGYESLVVGNLYGFKATHPRDLRQAGYPPGRDNEFYLRSIIAEAALVICAWGANARSRPADATKVLQMIRDAGRIPYALRLLRDGVPEHPLYLPLPAHLTPL